MQDKFSPSETTGLVLGLLIRNTVVASQSCSFLILGVDSLCSSDLPPFSAYQVTEVGPWVGS